MLVATSATQDQDGPPIRGEPFGQLAANSVPG